MIDTSIAKHAGAASFVGHARAAGLVGPWATGRKHTRLRGAKSHVYIARYVYKNVRCKSLKSSIKVII